MEEAVVLAVIENLDSWLAAHRECNYGKLQLLFEEAGLCSRLSGMSDFWGDYAKELYNLVIGMAGFEEGNKEKLYSFIVGMVDDHKETTTYGFLVGMADFWEANEGKLYSLVVGMVDFGEHDKEKLQSLLANFWKMKKKKMLRWQIGKVDLDETDKEKLKSLVIGMAGLWEDDKEKLYSLVVGMADLWGDGGGELDSLETGIEIIGNWKEKEKRVQSFLAEMADLRGDVSGELQSLLVEMADLWEAENGELEDILLAMVELWGIETKRELYRFLVEMRGIGKHKNLKLNQEKLHRWLANKADLWEANRLLSLLLKMALLGKNYGAVDEGIEDFNHSLRSTVELIRNELRFILDRKLEEEEGSCSLCFIMSDVAEIAGDARLFVQLMDSDPFILFLRIFHRQERSQYVNTTSQVFLRKIDDIHRALRETKECMLELEVERSNNVEEAEGVEDVTVVGLEEDIKLLLHNEEISTTTFIKGMAGIGKTTLARELYNHPTVIDEFKCRAWVCLSRASSRKEVLIKLIRQVVHDNINDAPSLLEKMNSESLQRMLYQRLKGRQYFIVLDDVSESKLFRYVFLALRQNEDKGSRLLFTTRRNDVKCSSLHDYIHHMKFLDEHMSWKLLKTVFFGSSGEEFPKPVEKKAREMLRKCNGLPLAIKEVGMQWAKKRLSGSEWDEVVESVFFDNTLVVLESSYHSLSSKVKACFLHLCFFKEDTTIRVEKLVQIWTAGRVVSQEEDCTHHYFSELIPESIIEVVEKTRTNYHIKTCRVNPIFHRLSITKAEDEISFEIVRKDGSNRRSHGPRHRAIYCSREKFEYSTNIHDKRLVSLFFHGGGYFDTSPSYWQHFERLKILDMEGFGLKILPEAVGTLIELRYLGLRNNYIQELPHSFSCLKKLEVLDIAQNFTVEVADIIWEMDSLRHLFMSDISWKKPLKIDALKNLVTLTYISIDSWTYELSSLEIMESLCELGIDEVGGQSDMRKLFASLAELENLERLSLRGFRFRSMPSLDELRILRNLSVLKLDGRLTSLPSAENFPSIRHLSLVNSCLDDDPMPILEDIYTLKYLKLQNAYTGQQMVISPEKFYLLHYMFIREFWHLKLIRVGKNAMENLVQLQIIDCPCLETVPEEIVLVESLEELKMKTTKKIAKNIRENSSFIYSKISEVDIQP